jgi:hypothetical protein
LVQVPRTDHADRLTLAVEQRELTGIGLQDLGDCLGPLGRIPGQALRAGRRGDSNATTAAAVMSEAIFMRTSSSCRAS